MNPLPDGSRIRVQGVLEERFRAALRRQVEGPEFTREFILSDVTGSYWRVFTEYAGDISGRFIGAASLGRAWKRTTPNRAASASRSLCPSPVASPCACACRRGPRTPRSA